MIRAEWVAELAQARAATVDRLLAIVAARFDVELTRPPAAALLLATAIESVAGGEFHPGEILVTTCEARIGDCLGAAVVLGGDADKARGCATIDAALQHVFPERATVLSALEDERRWRQEQQRDEAAMVRSTLVKFDTMEVQR